MTFREIDELPERRVLASIILQAIEDLGEDKEAFLEDENGKEAWINVGEDAKNFLLGREKSLRYICNQLDLRADVIKKMVRKNPILLKEKLRALRAN